MKDFWELLNLVEDKIKYGYKEEHETPEFSIQNESTECRDCPLYLIRNSIVYGKGSDNPKLFIIGTWPTNEDEANNSPISGECGEFLNKWITAMKLSPFADCYITNILKCKTGWNKRGFNGSHNLSQEINTCFNHLEDEIIRLKPKVILTLGERPAQVMANSNLELEQLRGHIHRYKGIPVISTYHPEVALENYEALRAPVWEDLKLVINELNG
ncbi:MAG: uracil-DNA glycosylase [Spirochaetales bacterium]|nr:uracil-DNA glycosylase [Spirochaetales bacterium]